jgi:hypothetical protein
MSATAPPEQGHHHQRYDGPANIFGDDNPLGKRIRSWRDENQLRRSSA